MSKDTNPGRSVDGEASANNDLLYSRDDSFERWFDKHYDKTGTAKTDLKFAWNAAMAEAAKRIADVGSQHFDHNKECYVDSHELLDSV